MDSLIVSMNRDPGDQEQLMLIQINPKEHTLDSKQLKCPWEYSDVKRLHGNACRFA